MDKTITQQMEELEKAVSDATSKKSIMELAAGNLTKAQDDYAVASNKVRDLQEALQARIGNMFPQTGPARVKVS